MKELTSSGISFRGGLVTILDQQLLPTEEKWIPCDSLETMVSSIRALKVRGAPAIGVAAALFLASEVLRGKSAEEILKASAELRASRPTAVNLMNYLDLLNPIAEEAGPEWEAKFCDAAEQIFTEDVELCERIATNGLTVLPEGGNVLTHCNTGGIATAGRGTALGIFTKAHEEGRKIHVWVDETRPLLQGGRLTTWELQQAGVPYTLIADSMAGMVMSQGKVDCVIVGADRIAANGDFANKIGTYSLAVLANFHKVPFYVAAPTTTIDPDCQSGSAIPIEERNSKEVHGFSGALGELYWSPEDAPAYNPAFDVTPASLVSGWILDTRVATTPSDFFA